VNPLEIYDSHTHIIVPLFICHFYGIVEFHLTFPLRSQEVANPINLCRNKNIAIEWNPSYIQAELINL